MSVTLLDYLARLVMAVAALVIGLVNAAWSAFDWTGANTALAWFGRFDAWVPVATLASIWGLLTMAATVAVVIKFGQKVIDWLPFT